MKIVPTRSDLLLFTTTIVTTAVVMILAYDNWQQVRNANYRVEDSRQALGKINAISSLLRDAETDQRNRAIWSLTNRRASGSSRNLKRCGKSCRRIRNKCFH